MNCAGYGQELFHNQFVIEIVDVDAVWHQREIEQNERNRHAYKNAEPLAPLPRPVDREPFVIPKYKGLKND